MSASLALSLQCLLSLPMQQPDQRGRRLLSGVIRRPGVALYGPRRLPEGGRGACTAAGLHRVHGPHHHHPHLQPRGQRPARSGLGVGEEVHYILLFVTRVTFSVLPWCLHRYKRK